MSIDAIISGVVAREAGYVDHPSDKGGPTNWGITQAVARRHGYTGLMRDLPRAMAVRIYMADYVTAPGFDRIVAVSERIGEELIDTGINMGVSLPGPWLQRILNAMNQQAKVYPDLVVDGQLGPATVAALRSFLARRGANGEKVALRALNSLQGARYLEITEAREKNEDFIFGWFLNRVEVV